jgi:hypothetical protein
MRHKDANISPRTLGCELAGNRSASSRTSLGYRSGAEFNNGSSSIRCCLLIFALYINGISEIVCH